VLDNTVYRHGVDTVLQCCLTLVEEQHILNDFHIRACGGRLSGIAISQKILCVGYYWKNLFKVCITTVLKCHPCQIFTKKMRPHPTPLHMVISIGPFTKWEIDFIACNPTSADGKNYIVDVVE